MDYTRRLRQFINSQNLYSGLRITAGVIIPSVILYRYTLLGALITIPLGALCVSLTDNPGPISHRRNSVLSSIVINFIVILITGSLRTHPAFIFLLIVVFGMLFSLIGVYGNRVNSIGVIALLVFIFNIDAHSGRHNIFIDGLWFSAGGIWYALMSLFLHTLRPYKLIQQTLGECLIETANYLQIKASFYDEKPNYDELFTPLIRYQVSIKQHQDELREMLFKTRNIVRESTVKGRVLMMMFLDSIDLFERVMTSQQDYVKLHKTFDGTGILKKFRTHLLALSDELHEIGLAVQSGTVSSEVRDIDDLLQETSNAFFELRDRTIKAETIEDLITLRQILFSMQDITERVKRLHRSTSSSYSKKISKEYRNDVELNKFINHQHLDAKLLLDNLSLKSGHFRHAVRLTSAMLVGYIISLWFPFGHGYWILLTITTIIKPAYSITKRRNIQRLSGTFIGAVFGFTIVYFIHGHAVLFLIMLVCMVIAYSLLKINYFVSSACITTFVLISFNFLNPNNFTVVMADRIADTSIGCVIAFIFAVFVLPVWEHEQISNYISEALKANRKYFRVTAEIFIGKRLDVTNYKLERKNAFVALANLSDNFQRMLSEPKNKQHNMEQYHQFVASSHMLTSYIASLAYYAQRFGNKYSSEEFVPVVKRIDKQFQIASEMMQKGNKQQEVQEVHALSSPLNHRIRELLELRRKELTSGASQQQTSVRKTLSELKTITDQFELINTTAIDEIKILERITS